MIRKLYLDWDEVPALNALGDPYDTIKIKDLNNLLLDQIQHSNILGVKSLRQRSPVLVRVKEIVSPCTCRAHQIGPLSGNGSKICILRSIG
jgi:hypothetical protein